MKHLSYKEINVISYLKTQSSIHYNSLFTNKNFGKNISYTSKTKEKYGFPEKICGRCKRVLCFGMQDFGWEHDSLWKSRTQVQDFALQSEWSLQSLVLLDTDETGLEHLILDLQLPHKGK